MKPLISYYGGKQRLASKIVPLIPKHTVYVEPFAGGCAVLFAKPYPDVGNNDHYREVINDTDELLINLYRQFQDNYDALKHKLDYTLYSKSEHRKATSICKAPDGQSALDKAWAYYVNIQMGYSNKLSSGWKRSINAGNNEPFVFHNKVKRFNALSDRVKKVHIESIDALDCIKKWDSPQTFFYCDPPYPGAAQGHYSGYTMDDFKSLTNTMEDIKGSFLLSNYAVCDMPEDWQRFDIKAYSSARLGSNKQSGARTECLWYKPATGKLRPELVKVMNKPEFNCFSGLF